MCNSYQLLELHFQAEKFKEERLQYREHLSISGWWKQMGGVFVISPRQTGKTTSLRGYERLLKMSHPHVKTLSVCPYQSMIDILDVGDIRTTSKNFESLVTDIDPKDYHLLCDEFMLFDHDDLDQMLRHSWRSVTMIGSMK